MSRAVLFDVDGTLIDAAANQRRVWALWAHEFAVDPNTTYGFTFGLLYAQERTRAKHARRDYEPALRKASTTRARRWTQ